MVINTFLAAACLIAGGQRLSQVDTAREAVKLLPEKPKCQVVLVDPERDLPQERRDEFRDLVGFTFPGHQLDVYLNTRSPLFEEARLDSFYRHALAVVIVHELTHLAGGDEPAAQQAEERAWLAFIREGRVDRDRAMEFGALMRSRRKEDR